MLAGLSSFDEQASAANQAFVPSLLAISVTYRSTPREGSFYREMPACSIPEGLRRINGLLPFKQKWHGCGASKNYLHNQPTPLLVSQLCESCRDSSCCLVCCILLRVVLVLFAATLTFRFRSRSLLRPRAAYVALYCFCPPSFPFN